MKPLRRAWVGWAAVLAGLAAGLSRAEADAIRYRVMDISDGSGFTETIPYGLSNTGLVVGVGGFPNPTGFLYDSRSGRFLETAAKLPYDVNDAGQVADSRDVGEVAINNRGQVIGDGFGGVGYLRTGDVTSPIPGIVPGTTGAPKGLNDAGQVVGYAAGADGRAHPFLSSDGRTTDLGLLPGATSASAMAINASGQVVGGAWNGQSHPFLYDGQALHDLGTLGGASGLAWDINASGQIVGWSETVDSGGWHAFLHDGGRMLDLNDLVESRADLTLEFARAINDAGQILVSARDAGNHYHALLLTPTTVPEPSPIVLCGVVAGLGLARSAARRARSPRGRA
jgi:probable HAF family extracellular repeat protein